MTNFPFNNRAAGIFADGYVDRDGAPVGDTFVWRLRAKLVGMPGRDWSRDQHAAFVAKFSSAEMSAMMCEPEDPHLQVVFCRNYRGGYYTGAGEHVYVPETLVDLLDGDVAAAFTKFTGLDAAHVVSYSGDERFDAHGEPLEMLEHSHPCYACYA